MSNWLDDVRWDAQGLAPAIAQDYKTGEVLMVAWMNKEALQLSAEQGHAVYWSRSRNKLWHKGEESGHQQKIHAIRLDCDEDAILLSVEQKGGIACHTGRQSCFYRELSNEKWLEKEAVLKDPKDIYKK
ncbi:MAG: phosphoribosyl-AMP cyclohydrolase [Cycloclasticus sp. symbiont of Poecilosclerida sp. M]|nr:MAG: phosphoribosyl-AMP cyclohydrolase [Cycloclasticus sp. symbiont of Poecilosclerida sp. M]